MNVYLGNFNPEKNGVGIKTAVSFEEMNITYAAQTLSMKVTISVKPEGLGYLVLTLGASY